MTTVAVQLPDDQAQRLQALAERLNVSVEEFVRTSIRDLLERPDEAFQRAADYVLNKNSELYRRLARS